MIDIIRDNNNVVLWKASLTHLNILGKCKIRTKLTSSKCEIAVLIRTMFIIGTFLHFFYYSKTF